LRRRENACDKQDLSPLSAIQPQESSLDANGMREYEATEALGIGKIGAEELEDSQTEEEGRTAWRFGEKESGSELGHGVSMCAGVDDVEISMGRQS